MGLPERPHTSWYLASCIVREGTAHLFHYFDLDMNGLEMDALHSMLGKADTRKGAERIIRMELQEAAVRIRKKFFGEPL